MKNLCYFQHDFEQIVLERLVFMKVLKRLNLYLQELILLAECSF